MREELDAEAFADWREHPCTKALFATLRNWTKERQESWKNGDYLGEGHFATMVVNARAVGECGLATAILELDLEGLIEGSKEDE